MRMVIVGYAESADSFWGSLEGVHIHQVTDVSEISGGVGANDPRVVVIRLTSEKDVDEVRIAAIRRNAPGLPIVAWLPQIDPEDTFRLMNIGFDGLVTDNSTQEQRADIIQSLRLTREESLQRIQRTEEPWRRSLVGGGNSMRMVCQLIRLVSQRRCTVLITGETGSGKEMVAKAIHEASPRATQPMVSINCNAIPGELLEAELFGHVKGAYTGAFQNRIGRFEQANKGTLFLDEIGDMPFPLQAKLLRVLQEREVQRLGSSDSIKVDVRVIAATNANLHRLVQEGKFRQDLYYRLHVAPIEVPPLRERLEDIPILVSHFVDKICLNEQIPVKNVPREIVDCLQSMPWPGNVRELENTVESAIAVSGDHPSLRMVDFAALFGKSSNQSQMFAMPDDGIDYNAVVSRFERILLSEALRRSGGSKKMAASLLQLKRSTFSAKLDVLGISKESDGEQESPESIYGLAPQPA
ncbi:MAG: sigma-54 dependent transcriptional regulator [Acidobacteriota bacterium]